MSNVCCKEFKGWVKSFTKIERVLAILEAILLVVFVILLILLILHLIVCSQAKVDSAPHGKSTVPPEDDHHGTSAPTSHIVHHTSSQERTDKNTGSIFGNKTSDDDKTTSLNRAKVSRHYSPSTSAKICSWTPSAKTVAVTHYYEGFEDRFKASIKVSPKHSITESYHVTSSNTITTNTDIFKYETDATAEYHGFIEEIIQSDRSDGEEAEDELGSHVAALIKPKPPSDTIFGCILTIVSEHWTLTAASCIESIEEVDSLDSFVIMERYGTGDDGPLRAVRDVRIHPLYEGKNKSYDLAALRSAASLVERSGAAVELASMLDYSLSALGESFTILGYGPLRSIDRSESGRSLRRAAVRRLPARACGGGRAGALRHLLAGRAAQAGGCGGGAGAGAGAGALCCGPVFARGLVCNYCAGTPLLREGRLYGLMADNDHCGLSCEPLLYVNVADLRDWIESVTRER